VNSAPEGDAARTNGEWAIATAKRTVIIWARSRRCFFFEKWDSSVALISNEERLLHSHSVQVCIVHGRRKAEADRVVKEIVAFGGTAVATIVELGSDDQTK
jgi:hypothetical protein